MRSVFEYDDIVIFLQDSFAQIKIQRPRYSLRSWSQRIGFKSPASLSRILSRTRKPTLAQVRTISKGLSLSQEEALYLETIVQCEPKQLAHLAPQLRSLFNKSKSIDILKLSIENFNLISEWYYPALLESLSLKQTFKDVADFQQVLGAKVSLEQIQKALRDLEGLGLIVKTEAGYARKEAKTNYVEPEEASIAVRHYHSQMLQHAQESLGTIAREYRDVRGMTLAIKKENYQQVQRILENAFKDLMSLSEDSQADQVYHLSTAFFPLSKQNT